jgi:hypothetical protein
MALTPTLLMRRYGFLATLSLDQPGCTAFITLAEDVISLRKYKLQYFLNISPFQRHLALGSSCHSYQ